MLVTYITEFREEIERRKRKRSYQDTRGGNETAGNGPGRLAIQIQRQ